MLALRSTGQGVDMSLRSRIVAFIIAVVFVVLGVLLMIQRIGAVIGWNNAASGWWVIVLLVGLMVLMAFIIYIAVRNKLNS
jgi:hypothetical protein